MKSKLGQILIAAVVQLLLLAVFCAVVLFAFTTEFFVLNPFALLIPVLLGLCIIDFIALTMIYRKNN